MITIKKFTFGPFAENTYVLHDETRECIIIDPGCYFEEEREELNAFITDQQLKPVRLVLTHAHLDHVMGSAFVESTWKLRAHMHRDDLYNLERFDQVCRMYGVPAQSPSTDVVFIDETQKITFGNSSLDIFFTPGHSSGSISFYSADQKFIIGGDVLFNGSIGRTDLPGGNFETLAHTIRTVFYTLPPDTTVYSGHGAETEIGYERAHNPFVTA